MKRSSRAIGTAETVELVWLRWLSPRLLPSADAGLDVLFHLTLNLLVQIATRSPNDALSDRVWDFLSRLAKATPDSARTTLTLTSGLAPRLNVGRIVPELLQYVAAVTDYQRYVFYLRLCECAQPAHLIAWNTMQPSDDFEAVRMDAEKPTGMTGTVSTVELNKKEAAWDILLCRGVRSLLPSFADALAGEKSGHVLGRFLDFAGCLGLASLPSEISELLAGAPDRQEWSSNERLIAQVGAIRAAHGALSKEAFDVLLGYRQVGSHGVLLSLVDALAETAMLRLTTEDRTPVNRILEAAEKEEREDTRGAAAGVVSVLLERGYLTEEEVTKAAAVLSAPATDHHGRRELLFAFASRPPIEVPASVAGYAASILDQPATEENGNPHAALAVVARRPESRTDSDFLSRRLGLVESDGALTAGPTTFNGIVPHVVGRYFASEPERFGQAVASIVAEGDTWALYYVLPSIREAGSGNPPVVIDALLARLRWADSGSTADLPLLHVFSRVAPDRLLADGCHGTDAWLPQARADLADTLARLSDLTGALAETRFNLLVRLSGDGIYAVRRAAYRAAAECDPPRFANLVHGWAEWREPGREGPRRRAAECVGWLPSDGAESVRALRWDQEPGVRDAYERSMKEREERERAREYEKYVLSVWKADEVIAAWRYGVALSQVGDDSTIARLVERGRSDVPPTVRFWLSRVRNTVERRWGDVTRKWPDPWFARPGTWKRSPGPYTAKSATSR